MAFLAASVSPSAKEGHSQRLFTLQRRRVLVSVPQNAAVPSFCTLSAYTSHNLTVRLGRGLRRELLAQSACKLLGQ